MFGPVIVFAVLAVVAQAAPVPLPAARAVERFHNGPVYNGAPCWQGEDEGTLSGDLCVIAKRFVSPDGVVSAVHEGNILGDLLASGAAIPILSGLSLLQKRFMAPHAPGGVPSVVNDAVTLVNDIVERGLLNGDSSGLQADVGNLVEDTESVVSGIATLGGPTHDGLLPLLGLRDEVEARNFIEGVAAAAQALERHGLFNREISDGARRVFGDLLPGRGVGFAKRDLLGLGDIANGLGLGTGTGEILSSEGGLLSTGGLLNSVPLVSDTVNALLGDTTS